MKKTGPIRRILLPVDGSETSRKTIEFAGRLGAALGENLEGVTLLQVMEGSYLGHGASALDLRADLLMQSNTFKKLKIQHINKNIQPFLNKGEGLLKNLGVRARIESRIVDGEPAREIVRMAEDGRFSTIIMGRRGLSPNPVILFGSVTDKVVKSVLRQDVYVVGKNPFKNDKSLIANILVAVDGSPNADRAVDHAARLAAELAPAIQKITLLSVIHLAYYEQKLKSKINPDMEAQKILEKAQRVLWRAAVPEDIIDTRIRIGNPTPEILAETKKGQDQLVILGREGKTSWKRLFLGSVSSTVLHRCQNATVVIVRNE